MKRFLLTIGVALVGACQADAQSITAGPELGIQLANMRAQVNGAKSTSQLKSGLRAGLLLDIKVTDDLSIHTGGFYTKKGYELENTQTLTQSGIAYDRVSLESVTINYIQVPLTAQYKFSVGTGYVFAGAGPYVAVALNGRSLLENTTIESANPEAIADVKVGERDVKIGSTASSDVKKYDYGFNANAGYMWDSGFLVRAGTDVGLANLAPASTSRDNSLRNLSFSLTFAYLISYR